MKEYGTRRPRKMLRFPSYCWIISLSAKRNSFSLVSNRDSILRKGFARLEKVDKGIQTCLKCRATVEPLFLAFRSRLRGLSFSDKCSIQLERAASRAKFGMTRTTRDAGISIHVDTCLDHGIDPKQAQEHEIPRDKAETQ